MPEGGSAQSNPPTFTPEFADETRARLRALLGPTWGRIVSEDVPSRPARDRHLLAVLDEKTDAFRADFLAARMPGHLPDFLTLYVIVEVLTRMSRDDVFGEVISGLADRSSFRHDMLTLGLADHLRRLTAYQVSLPPRSPIGERTVDIVLGSNPEMYIETKSSDEFDGPNRHVSSTNAFRGIRNAWRRAYGGVTPQVSPVHPSALLVGGISVELASLPSVARSAEAWLRRRGAQQPNCWGILGMTFLTYSRLPPGRSFGDGGELSFDALAGVHLAYAKNPLYTGPVDIVFTSPAW
jgi:hypothetical protein